MNILFPVLVRRVFFWNFFPGVGGSSKSAATTNTDQSTKVQTTNNQAGASEGSIAIGAGANAVIESSDTETVQAAADAIEKAAGNAVAGNVDVSKAAIAGNADVSKSVVRDALDFGDTSLRTVEQANAILSRTFETYAGNLKDNSGIAPTSVLESTNKTMLYGIAGLGIVVVLFMLNKGSK